MTRLFRRTAPLAALLALPALLAAQEAKWVASLSAGYANALEANLDAPGAGPTTTLFVGRRLGDFVVLGVEGGWHQPERGTIDLATPCPTGTPPDAGCTYRNRSTGSEWQATLAARFGPLRPTIRPYGMVGAGYYRLRSTSERSIFLGGNPGNVIPGTNVRDVDTGDAAGAHAGLGVDWAPKGGRWTLGVGGRVHGIVGDEFGEGIVKGWFTLALSAGLAF